MLLVLLCSGCATTMNALSDYDHSQDFSHYKAFAWMDGGPVMGPQAAASGSSALNRHRTVEAIQAEQIPVAVRRVLQQFPPA